MSRFLKWMHHISVHADHYRVEISSAIFSVLACALLAVSLTGSVQAREKNTKILSDRAMYTTAFKSSLTAQSGTVEGVYTNKENTRALVLLKFTDTNNISLNADNYKLFLSGSDNRQNILPYQGDVKGSLYAFGDTGCLGVLLESQEPFSPQIVRIMIRNIKELTDKKDSSTVNSSDRFDSQYDTIKVFCNPSASEAVYASCLDSEGTINPLNLYTETIAAAQEKEIKEDLSARLREMKIAYDRIDEYTDRLGREGLIDLEAPDVIAGDSFTLLNPEYRQDAGKDAQYAYVPGYVVGKGFEFDWRNRTIADGYYSTLIPQGTTRRDYLIQKSAEDESVIRTKDLHWTFSDGSTLDQLKDSGSDTEYARINQSVQDLIAQWNTYLSLKKDYEINGVRKLLDLEDDLSYIESKSTINSAPDAFQVY